MKNGNRSRIIVTIVIAVLIALIVVLGIVAYNVLWKPVGVQKFRQDASEQTPTSEPNVSSAVDMAENPIDFKALQKINKEIYAWLYVPDTEIDYPLLQSEVSDGAYLNTDIYGNYNYAGSLYTECCNSTDMTDRVTVIYGHNMFDGSMFATLHRFRDKSFFKKHGKFYIYTPERKLTYQVVSAFEYDDRHLMNTNNYFANDAVFKEYLEYIQNPRSLSSNVRKKLDHKLTLNDRVVTLSTCLDVGDGRYLLQGVLIKDEPTG